MLQDRVWGVQVATQALQPTTTTARWDRSSSARFAQCFQLQYVWDTCVCCPVSRTGVSAFAHTVAY